MGDSLDAVLVRIRDAKGVPTGAGFLVSPRQVLTCAHVVAQALGIAATADVPPGATAALDLPRAAPGQLLTARVQFWRPVQTAPVPLSPGGDDLAVLELDANPPVATRLPPIVKAINVWGHRFRAFGFPRGNDSGVWATGRLLGRQADNWIQIEDVKATGYPVERGFSGGPVWDEDLQAIVGMVVAAEQRDEVKAAFVVPVDALAVTWPPLDTFTTPAPLTVWVATSIHLRDAKFLRQPSVWLDLPGERLTAAWRIWILGNQGIMPGTPEFSSASVDVHLYHVRGGHLLDETRPLADQDLQDGDVLVLIDGMVHDLGRVVDYVHLQRFPSRLPINTHRTEISADEIE